MERKKLRVDGIPTDIPDGRAKDKLTIHFLRSRNGGGDVENIEIIQENPAYAIVTFEDDDVVESVLRTKDHTLEVNDKIYNLVVSEVTGKMELEEVFQKLSLTVNYRKFPENCRSLLKNLTQTRKDLKFDFDKKSTTCTIGGPYAEIQTLAQEILSKLETGYTNLKQTSSDARKKMKIDHHKNHSDLQDVPQALEQRSGPLYGTALETRSIPQTESLEQLQEPFVWDSDIFKYIQKFNKVDYQEILSKYHVQAVDESADDITTIYLQGVHGGKNHLANLRSARSRLLGLYQGLEILLRKEQIDKRNVYGDQNLHRQLMRDLQKLYPMLLCHDDDKYIYLIGNGVDVAQGKQYISDLQMRFDTSSSYADTPFKASGASTMSEGMSPSLSPTYKHEGKVGSRIAASFNAPTTHGSYLSKSQIDEKYLVSSSSQSRQPLDRERDPTIDRSSLRSSMTSDLYKNEDFSHLQADDKSEGKAMPSLKRRDVLPALKTGREDIRQGRSTSKPTGPLKPVRFTKASSELPYSSLVDMNSSPVDFKIPEGKLRRSNSLSRVYSKESTFSEQQSDLLIFKDEVIVTDWLWHYMKHNHKSDIDSWCSEVVLTEEKKNGKVTLKLKATSKPALTLTRERIQLLCWKEDANVTSSCLHYTTLRVQGPDDVTLVEWCDLFRKCSKKLSVKLEEDKLVLVYPKEIEARVLGEYSQHIEHKVKPTGDEALAGDGHREDNFEFSGNNRADDFNTELQHKQSVEDKLLSKLHIEPSVFHLGSEDRSRTNNYEAGKDLADQKYSLVGGTDPFRGITHENKPFFDAPVPSVLDENSPKEHRNFFEDPNNSSTSEKHQMDVYTSRKLLEKDVKTDVKSYDHGPYTSQLLTQGFHFSPPNVQNQRDLEPRYGDQGIFTEGPEDQSSSSRIPAVGQESEKTETICVQCKNSGRTVETLTGQNLCLKCFTTSILSELNDKAKGTPRATMTHTSMSLTLPGYERDTTLKIIYEVPDGVQGAGDPQPGCPYKGGKFEAYLPENREGKKLLGLLQRALDEGLIFHIKTFDTEEKITWYKIPHKTSPDGGKPKNGYPDLTYVKSTLALLKQYGIE